jgi:hypothetical protein
LPLTMPFLIVLLHSIRTIRFHALLAIEQKLQLWRTVDPNSTDTLHPGFVTTNHIRQKLSKQLKIDLDESEPIHILRNENAKGVVDANTNASTTSAATTTSNPLNFAELDDAKIQTMADELVPVPDIQINRLGEYLAVIGLKGGYAVPLRVLVLKRA